MPDLDPYMIFRAGAKGNLQWYPVNDRARSIVRANRKTVEGEDLDAAVALGETVLIDLNSYLGSPPRLVRLMPYTDATQRARVC